MVQLTGSDNPVSVTISAAHWRYFLMALDWMSLRGCYLVSSKTCRRGRYHGLRLGLQFHGGDKTRDSELANYSC